MEHSYILMSIPHDWQIGVVVMEKETTCCFTGHRPEKLDVPKEVVIQQLDVAIQDAIRDGYTTFLSGVSRGVDLWAAELLVQYRQSIPNVKLVCAVPFEGFGLHWKNDWTEKFVRILHAADSVQYVCKGYSRSAYQERNQWMVDRVSLVIAAYNGKSGGTKNTIAYAEQNGKAARSAI